MTSIAVIVPFRNAAETIELCLDALTRQSLDPAEYEIVAIDDGSTDGSAAIARRFGRVRTLAQDPGGPYRARNLGVSETSAPLLAFTDADCIAAPDWLERLVEGMSEPGAQVVMGRDRPAGTSLAVRLLSEYDHQKERIVLGGTDPTFYYGHTNNLATRRPLLERLGGFDERPRGADVIFVQRVLERYGTDSVRYRPEALVEHLEIDSPRVYFRKAFIYGASARRYGSVVDARPLRARQRIAVFREAVSDGSLSAVEAAYLLVLLAVGVGFYEAGRILERRSAPDVENDDGGAA